MTKKKGKETATAALTKALARVEGARRREAAPAPRASPRASNAIPEAAMLIPEVALAQEAGKKAGDTMARVDDFLAKDITTIDVDDDYNVVTGPLRITNGVLIGLVLAAVGVYGFKKISEAIQNFKGGIPQTIGKAWWDVFKWSSPSLLVSQWELEQLGRLFG